MILDNPNGLNEASKAIAPITAATPEPTPIPRYLLLEVLGLYSESAVKLLNNSNY
jgi:hypothetical protein